MQRFDLEELEKGIIDSFGCLDYCVSTCGWKI